jgi:hypothetical protein
MVSLECETNRPHPLQGLSQHLHCVVLQDARPCGYDSGSLAGNWAGMVAKPIAASKLETNDLLFTLSIALLAP